MEQCLVTIVVPIYNTEKYLDRCIKSLVSQTYRNLEIILVNDCSSDGCSQICDQWAMDDARIQVIHKTRNEGQGIARNDGMNHATGKYICFFDSDDYIMEDTIQRSVSALEAENAELAIFGMKTIAADGTTKQEFIPAVGAHTYRGKEVEEFFLPNLISEDPKGTGIRLFYMSAWLFVYSLDKIKKLNWRFVSEREIISEDVYSLIDLLGGISSVTVVPEAFYCCCENSDSFSRSYIPNRYEKFKYFYLETLKLCCRKGYNAEVVKRVSKPYLAYTIAALKQETKAPTSLSKRRKTVYAILKDQTLHDVLQKNRDDYANASRKLLYFLIRNKIYGLSCLLCALKK